MTTVENKISKAKRNFLIIGTAVALAVGLTACSETEVEVLETKTVTYAVSGHEDTYAVAYSDKWVNDPTAPFLSPGQRIIDMHDGYGEASFEAMSGDSVSVFVMDARTYSRVEVANVTVSVGRIIVARGNTEETGFYSVSGRVGGDLFGKCNKQQ